MELAATFATQAGTASAISAAGSTIGPITAVQSGIGTLSNIFSLSSLSTGLSFASMASDIFGGVEQGKAAALQLEQQAQQDLLDAKQADIQGKQESNDIMDNLLQTIATQRLAYSGAGTDFSFGTPQALERNLRTNAERQLGTSRDNTRMKALSRRRSAYLRQSQVSQAQNAPVYSGLSSAGKTFSEMVS